MVRCQGCVIIMGVVTYKEAAMETILLIEHNYGLREALRETLQVMGYEVLAATSGPEALAMVNGGQSIDVVISDLVMQGMNAMELHNALQARHFSGQMLLITDYPMPYSGASLATQPGVTWARKPIGQLELRLILAQMTMTRPPQMVEPRAVQGRGI